VAFLAKGFCVGIGFGDDPQTRSGMSETTRSQLSTVHIFAGIDEAVMDLLAEACRERHAAAGEIVVEQNALASEMFVIATAKH
jgi:hypothetical protein